MKNTNTNTNTNTKDFYGIDINIGDTVTFPAGGEMMDGVVEKFRNLNRFRSEAFVKNSSGHKKWKVLTCLINRTSVEDAAPQLFI